MTLPVPINAIGHPEGIAGRPVGAGAGPMTALTAAQIREISETYSAAEVDGLIGAVDLSGLVPYTGATGNVDLGAHNLTTTRVQSTGNLYLGQASNWPAQIGYTTIYSSYLGITGIYGIAFAMGTGGMAMTNGGALYPLLNNRHDFGTSSLRWKSAYFSSVLTASDLVTENGTSPTSINVHSTYTSATSFESLKIQSQTAGSYRIGSAIGSAGGTNRDLEFGTWDSAGTFSSKLTIGTDGTLTMQQSVALADSSGNGIMPINKRLLLRVSNTSAAMAFNSNSTNLGFLVAANEGGLGWGNPGGSGSFNAQLNLVSGVITANNFDKTARVGISCGSLQLGDTATLAASTTSASSLNIPSGVAPTTPTIGDIWHESDTLKYQDSTTTRTLATETYVDSAVSGVDLSGYVPYTGATAALNLGAFGLSASTGTFSGDVSSSTQIFRGNSLIPISGDSSYLYGNQGGLAARFRRQGVTWYQYSGGGHLIFNGSTGNSWDPVYVSKQFLPNGSLSIGSVTAPFTGNFSTYYSTINGTTATEILVHNTYTSSTSFETLRVKANTGAAYQIGSAIGSAGGTNRDLEFGTWNSAGTFTAGLTIATTGKVRVGPFKESYYGYASAHHMRVVSNQSVGYSLQDANSTAEWQTTIYGGECYSGMISPSTPYKLVMGNRVDLAPITIATSRRVGINTPTVVNIAASCHITGIETSIPSLIVDGMAGQTANLQEWRDSSDTVLTSVGPTGFITCDGGLSDSLFLGEVHPTFAGNKQTAVGVLAKASSAQGSCVAVGYNAYATGWGSTAIGAWTRASGEKSLAISGNNTSSTGAAEASGQISIAIGASAKATALGAIMMGAGTNSTSYSFSVGNFPVLCGSVVASNGTTPTSIEARNTYTSATSFETLRVKANTGAAYQIGSAIGSAGGTNRDLEFGTWNSAGTFTAGLTLSANGSIVQSDAPSGRTTGLELGNGIAGAASNYDYIKFKTNWGDVDINVWGGRLVFAGGGMSSVGAPSLLADYAGYLGISSGNVLSAAADIVLKRYAATTAWNAQADGGVRVRNLADSADAPLSASTGTFSGAIAVNFPSSTYATVTSWTAGGVTKASIRDDGQITGSSFYSTSGGTAVDVGNGTVRCNRIVQGGSVTVLDRAGQFLNGNTSLQANAGVEVRPAAGYGVHVLNSTNAQQLSIYNTYTSATSYETLQIKANTGAAYQIGSAIGSAGGTNRDLEFGRWDSAGTWTPRAVVNSSGIQLPGFNQRIYFGSKSTEYIGNAHDTTSTGINISINGKDHLVDSLGISHSSAGTKGGVYYSGGALGTSGLVAASRQGVLCDGDSTAGLTALKVWDNDTGALVRIKNNGSLLQFDGQTADVNLNTVTLAEAPTASMHAATKQYVDTSRMYSTEEYASTATYNYFGFTTVDGLWKVNRFDVTTGAKTTAQDSNNGPGTYADLTAAWVDYLTLTYS